MTRWRGCCATPSRCCRFVCWDCGGSGGNGRPEAVLSGIKLDLMARRKNRPGGAPLIVNGKYPRGASAGMDRGSDPADRIVGGFLELGLVHPDRAVARLGVAGAAGDDHPPARAAWTHRAGD